MALLFTLLTGLAANAKAGEPAETALAAAGKPMQHLTAVSIAGDQFLINGKPTHEGRSYRGKRIEGLLLNSRMVQGIFDDLNPDTATKWAYPDTELFNEDDHFDFDKPVNNFIAAVGEYASWGYFDFRQTNDPIHAGYQSVPVDWSIHSPRKLGFFNRLAEITGTTRK